jgi:thymidylate synthase (FAD)
MKAEYICHMGDDLLVANAARVSFSQWSDTFNVEADTRLIDQLAKNQHISPFFHPQITLRITAPLFVARQAMRHQVGFAVNEVSRRHVEFEPDFYRPEWRKRSDKRSMSDEEFMPAFQDRMNEEYAMVVARAIEAYSSLLAKGVAPEQARMILPQSMYTQWIWTGSLFAWARFYNQRSDPHAQKEIRLLAEEITRIIEPLFPVSWNALIS